MVFRVFCRHFGFAAEAEKPPWSEKVISPLRTHPPVTNIPTGFLNSFENWGENDRMSEGVGGGEGKSINLSAS